MSAVSDHLAALTDPIVAVLHASDAVEARGAGTHPLGYPAPAGAVVVRAPSGVVRHDPDDLTVTVLAATPVAELDAALAEQGQFVPLDPRDSRATVGGTLAAGLSGVRRLGFGPLRDHVLEIRCVTGTGAVVKAGGPTVKNVTGYDLVRLLVGSLGTLAVFVQVTLRCRPLPSVAQWWSTASTPDDVLHNLVRPVAVLADRSRTYLRFEGEAADAAAVRATVGDAVEIEGVAPPGETCRGRISVPPGALPAVGAALDATGPGISWVGEWGVGTMHVGCSSSDELRAARDVAHAHGGWLLIESDGADLDPFGVARPNLALQRRVAYAFDPDGKLAPWRYGVELPAGAHR